MSDLNIYNLCANPIRLMICTIIGDEYKKMFGMPIGISSSCVIYDEIDTELIGTLELYSPELDLDDEDKPVIPVDESDEFFDSKIYEFVNDVKEKIPDVYKAIVKSMKHKYSLHRTIIEYDKKTSTFMLRPKDQYLPKEENKKQEVIDRWSKKCRLYIDLSECNEDEIEVD